MRPHVVLRYIGIVLLLDGAFMLISALISLFNNVDSGFYPLILSFLLTTILGLFPLIFVRKDDKVSSKESYGIVIGAWIVSCFVGMFPYLLWGGEFGIVNSWFESVSGFTTTGATIVNDVEALPRGLLFWRSSTHWLGGVGVVMFAMLILPTIGRTRKAFTSVELSSLAKENYNYRSQRIIQILLFVYVGLTLIETILLRIAGMNWFDSVNHAFSTISTGGFSTRTMSVAAFDNVAVEIIITIFMILAGMHFGLIFSTFACKRANIFRSEVSRYYLLSVIAFSIVISVNIFTSGIYDSLGEALRKGFFQAASLFSTTGFATADTNPWPSLSIVILIFASIQCGCAGSTAGGIKCDRIYLAFKSIKAKFTQQQHPNAIIRIKLNGVVQEESTINFAMLYIVLYFVFILVGTIVFTACGVGLTESFTGAIACLSNVGPGFGSIGSLDNYSLIPSFAKVFSTLLMLLGRLEIFGFIQLFLIKWWK